MAERLFDIFGGDNNDGGGIYDGGGGGLGGGDTGGGFGSDPTPSVTETQLQEGGKLAIAYGRHIVAGHLILHQTTAPVTILIALGEGPWDSIEKLWYNGTEILPADYHFHPGTPSSGTGDPDQGVDSFFPTGLTYSHTSYVALRIPTPFASDNPPDKGRALCKTMRVADFDRNGRQIGFGYSANPARVAADLIIVKAKLPPSRIDWPSWAAWRDECDQTISWDDGTTVRTIPRFECHVVFLDSVNLFDALNAVAATCASTWQDDGELIRFYGPSQTTPVHHFNSANLVAGSVKLSQRGITDRPNLARVKFRDLDNEFLAEASVASDRPFLQDLVGVVEAAQRSIPNCNYSQAQRLLERQMRLDSDNPLLLEFKGVGDSFHVLPGDYVWVTHPLPDWVYQKCLVIEATDEAAEKNPDTRSFLVQRIDGDLYRDTDHKPVQKAIAV